VFKQQVTGNYEQKHSNDCKGNETFGCVKTGHVKRSSVIASLMTDARCRCRMSLANLLSEACAEFVTHPKTGHRSGLASTIGEICQ
jgi:hypothetical protein